MNMITCAMKIFKHDYLCSVSNFPLNMLAGLWRVSCLIDIMTGLCGSFTCSGITIKYSKNFVYQPLSTLEQWNGVTYCKTILGLLASVSMLRDWK